MTGRAKKVRLTDAGVARLRPGETEYIVRDTRAAGLGVRVRPSGHRSFVWHGTVNSKVVRTTIGSAALMTVEEARSACRTLLDGSHPLCAGDPARRAAVPLFRDFVMEDWLPAYRGRYSSGWGKRVDRMVKRQLLPAFGAMRLDRIGRPAIERWFDAMSRKTPGAANTTLAVLRQIVSAAKAAGHVANDPVAGVRPNPGRKMTRFLSEEEIGLLHRTLDRLVQERPSRRAQADVIRLLLLTGCRKSEILTLRWSEVDGDMLRLVDAKTGPRTGWLSEAAQVAIARQPRTASAFVFPSPRNAARPQSRNLGLWHRARREARIEDVRLHDLRHTVASQAVAQGVPLPTVARMLGHSQPTMTLRYAHVGDREVEYAAERVGASIAAAMQGRHAPYRL
ncbi:MAG: tyrosine-type recombinase/integrase [Alphaproteobacteria bacterium]|nr:tyrosine-type recombinase/integrase [Alphaproteobacteria bacterium]